MSLGNRQPGQDVYLGDGVYASFDGFQIWLAVNHQDNQVVAIEPKVMENLVRYAAALWPEVKRLIEHAQQMIDARAAIAKAEAA